MSTAAPVTSWTDWLWGSVLFLAVVLAYQPAWFAGFIWDDDAYVTGNPVVVGPLGLAEIWTTKTGADICPLTITTFWLEHKLWGLNPIGYHLVNIVIHAINGVILGLVLRRLRIPGAWLGAALWTLHPVLVESVAWVSELKNTQATGFYLLSIFYFLRWLSGERKFRSWDFAFMLVFAVTSMLSKSSTVILPAVLALVAWWMDRRWDRRAVVGAAATLIFSAISILLSFSTQALGGVGRYQRSWPERIIDAGDAIWFYLGKLVWPDPLIMIYPRWEANAADWLEYLPLLGAITLLLLFWLKRDTWGRPWFFAFAYFLVALLPLLGFVEHYFLRFSLVADHFQNLAAMGPLALLAAGLTRGITFLDPNSTGADKAVGVCLVAVLATLTWNQALLYQDRKALWTYVVSENPRAWVGYNNLGISLLAEGDFNDAYACFTQAVALNPDYPTAHANLGSVLAHGGRVGEAIEHFRRAIELDPKYAEPHIDLGTIFGQTGRTDDSIAEFQEALAIQPYSAVTYYNLGLVYAHARRVDDAITAFREALKWDPGDSRARNNLGAMLLQEGRYTDAIAELQGVVDRDPKNVGARHNLGLAFSRSGRTADAIAEFQECLRLDPADNEARRQMGLVSAPANPENAGSSAPKK